MKRQNYREELRVAHEQVFSHIDNRTDNPEFLTWRRRTREALVGLFGRESDPVLDFDSHVAEVQKVALGDPWRLSVVADFLEDRLKDISSENDMINTVNDDATFDVVIVCALFDPELTAVKAIGDWVLIPQLKCDPQTYYSTTWTTKKDSKVRLVAAAPNQIGLTAAGVLAAKMIWRFRPKIVAIVGIAAGARQAEQGFGDILVPEHTYDYGSAKMTVINDKIQLYPNPNPLSIEAGLLGRLKEWQTLRTGLDNISATWKAKLPLTRLQIHIGPMFSSPMVLDANAPLKNAISHWRKLIGVEMEAHAVHRACHDTIQPAPKFICMKSISDFAEGKTDEWRHFSAFTSAQLLHQFLIAEWETLSH